LRASAGEFSEKWQGIASGLDSMGTQPHMADLLRLQTNLVQASVQYELVGKAVSRSTQNVDALVRMS
jgi:type III secretion protein I